MPMTALENPSAPRLDFGTFTLDPRTGEVWRAQRLVHVTPLPARLLRYLALNRLRVVSKAELARELWPGMTVEASALAQAIRAARKAVGDDGRRQDVIATVSGVGYRFVAEPLNATPPNFHTQATVPSYVGQRNLIRQLSRSVESLFECEPRLLLLSGDPGVGKSRAIGEISRFAWDRDVPVVRGGGNVEVGTSAYGPWIEAFEELSGIRPVEILRDRAPHLLGLGASRTSVNGEPDRFRALAAARHCLEESARIGPLVVALEDLHQSSAAAIELLEFLVNELDPVPLLFVVSYRDLELRMTPESDAALSRVMAHPRTSWIEVPPLSKVETAYLVEQHSGFEVPADEVSAIARFTGSNPFFAIELANHLHAEGGSPLQETHSSRIERNAVRALSERLGRLDRSVRLVLEVASVCGTSFDPAVVARAAGMEDVHNEIRIGVRERVVDEPPRGGEPCRFSHALVRDALYAELAVREGDCQATHLRVAEALREVDPELEVQAAYHVCAAAPKAGARRVAEAVERAVARATSAGDLETASTLYERGVEAFERIRSPAPSTRVRFIVAAGEFGVRGGSSSRDRARIRLDEAIAALRHRNEPELFARAVLARAYRAEIVGLSDQPTLDLLTEAISLLEGTHSALTAQLRSRRAIESRYAVGGEAKANEAVELAIREARASGDAYTRARVFEDASFVRWSVADPEGWLRLNQEIVEASKEANETELLFLGVKGLATAHLELGNRDAFEREVSRCAAIAEEVPAPFLQAVVRCFAGAVCFLDGDFDGAEQNVIQAASSGLSAIKPLAAGQLFFHRREMGRLGELEGAVRDFIEESPGIDMWPIALARSQVDAGQLDEARRALEGMRPIEEVPKDRNWLPTMIVLAESAAALEDRALCRSVFAALEPHARVNVVLGNGSLFLGQTSHYLGLLALTLERWQDATRHLEQAIHMHRQVRSAAWQLRTQSEQVHLLLGTGEARKARELAQQVSDRARALGMIRCAERAEAAG